MHIHELIKHSKDNIGIVGPNQNSRNNIDIHGLNQHSKDNILLD